MLFVTSASNSVEIDSLVGNEAVGTTAANNYNIRRASPFLPSFSFSSRHSHLSSFGVDVDVRTGKDVSGFARAGSVREIGSTNRLRVILNHSSRVTKSCRSPKTDVIRSDFYYFYDDSSKKLDHFFMNFFHKEV